MLQRIEKGLWYVFVFMLPFQTVFLLREVFIAGTKWQYGTMALYASEGILILWILTVLVSGLGSGTATVPDPLLNSGGKESGISECARPRIRIRFFCIFFFFWLLLSVSWSYDPPLSLSFALVFLLGGGLIGGMQKMKIDIQKTVFVFLLALFLQSLLGIGQFVFQEVEEVKWLGISAHESWEAGTSVLKTQSGRWLRAYGGMTHPNVFGGVLAIGLILAFWQWVESRQGRLKILYAGFFLTMFLALFLTFSRTAWAGFLLGLFVFLWLSLKRSPPPRRVQACLYPFEPDSEIRKGTDMPVSHNQRNSELKSTHQRIFFLSSLILFAGIIFSLLLSPILFSRFDGRTIDTEGSVADRIALAKEALSVWQLHPFLGVGIGTETLGAMEKDEFFPPLQRGGGESASRRARGETTLFPFLQRGGGESSSRRGSELELGERGTSSVSRPTSPPLQGVEEPQIPVWSYQPAHNVFLLVLSELGVVGLILFLGMFFGLIRIGIQCVREVDQQKIIFCSILVTLIPAMLLDHWLWTSHFGILLIAFLIGMLFYREEK